MEVNETIFKELLKRGYAMRGERRVWDISDSKLWFLTPDLSKGFLNLSPYRKSVLVPELQLLQENAHKLVEIFGNEKFNIIDLGCGIGDRAKMLIDNIPNGVCMRYCPVDVSNYFLEETSKKIREFSNEKVCEVKPFVSDFSDFDNITGMLRGGDFRNNLILLLGSRLANYEINEMLFNLSNGMFKGDHLIIGNGFRRGARFVELGKYKSQEFNDWFVYIMKGLGFEEDEIEYDARFEFYRVEGFYRINVDKTVDCMGKKIQFRNGDEVIVAVQYKFFENELVDFCNMYFSDVKVIKNSDGGYGLIVCRK